MGYCLRVRSRKISRSVGVLARWSYAIGGVSGKISGQLAELRSGIEANQGATITNGLSF